MKENITRRRLLYGAAIATTVGTAITAANGTVLANEDSTEAPQLGSSAELLRVMDNGDDEGVTTVRIINEEGATVFSGSVVTKGFHYPDLAGKTLEEKYPEITADIDSFGVPDGFYTVKVTHDGRTATTEIQVVGPGELVDGNEIWIKLEPSGAIDITVSHGDGGGSL